MSLHAIDDIGDAIDATKSFLLPFAARTWLKLAVVVFFISAGGGFSGVQIPSDFGGGEQPQPSGGFEQPPAGEFHPSLSGGLSDPSTVFTLLLGAAVALLLLFLLYGLVSNFMEFVFVQSLVSGEVHVRQYFRENLGNGLRLLAFRLTADVVTLLLAAVSFYTLFLTVLGGSLDNLSAGVALSIFPLALAFFVVLSILFGLIMGFTKVFVVPMMLTSDRGLLGSWKRLLGSMRRNLKQYAAYLLFSVVLGIGAGIIGSILGTIAALLLAIPFVLVGGGAFIILGGGTVALAIVAVSALLFVLCLLVVTNLIQVPLQAFLRYYAMLVMGDVDESLDPMPAVRADIRSAAEGDSPTEPEGL